MYCIYNTITKIIKSCSLSDNLINVFSKITFSENEIFMIKYYFDNVFIFSYDAVFQRTLNIKNHYNNDITNKNIIFVSSLYYGIQAFKIDGEFIF